MKLLHGIAIQTLLQGGLFILAEAQAPDENGERKNLPSRLFFRPADRNSTARRSWPAPGRKCRHHPQLQRQGLAFRHDGMPPSPFAPWVEGQLVLALDDAGNVIEQHETSISFFDGKYYL